jgi:imidazolonepropionase-like amidohydrolase
MIIQNAYIITMAGYRFENGYVQVKKGKISAIGKMADCPKAAQKTRVSKKK